MGARALSQADQRKNLALIDRAPTGPIGNGAEWRARGPREKRERERQR
jgi:hypothetical protein